MNVKWIIFLSLVFVLIVLVIVFLIQKKRKRKSLSPFQEALISLAEGDEDHALKKFQETVFSDSDNIEAYIRLAVILRSKNEALKALQIHKYLLARRKLTKKSVERILFQTALDYYSLSLYQKATDTLSKLLKLNSSNEKYYELLLNVFEKTALWSEAIELFRKMSRLFAYKKQETLRYEVYAANESARKGNRDWALKILLKAIKVDPFYVPSYIYAGDIEYVNGEVKKAIEKYKKAVEVDVHTAHIVFPRLMKAYFEKGEFQKIEEAYKGVLDILPDDTVTITALAEFYVKMGRTKEATELLNSAITNNPDSIGINLLFLATQLENEKNNLSQNAHKLFDIYNRETKHKCSNCGFLTEEYFIRCPDCGLWETFDVSKTN